MSITLASMIDVLAQYLGESLIEAVYRRDQIY